MVIQGRSVCVCVWGGRSAITVRKSWGGGGLEKLGKNISSGAVTIHFAHDTIRISILN